MTDVNNGWVWPEGSTNHNLPKEAVFVSKQILRHTLAYAIITSRYIMIRPVLLNLSRKIIRSMPSKQIDSLLNLSRTLRKISYLAKSEKMMSGCAYSTRDDLFSSLDPLAKGKVVYLEFGVYKGDSVRLFLDSITNTDVHVFGFDSFIGLPKDWLHAFGAKTPQGTFDVGGIIPDIDNEHVHFIKGWFENTFPEFLEQHHELIRTADTVFVHLDADFYEPSRFVLEKLPPFVNHLYFMCDEWTAGECEAIMEFADINSFEITFLGHVPSDVHQLPIQVMGELKRVERVIE